ncbi:MAG: tetratricopeptide repeat protein [Myxococcales bacterium]|nr:tetratricopeptide repeat protein [Myxococcales bacterium]
MKQNGSAIRTQHVQPRVFVLGAAIWCVLFAGGCPSTTEKSNQDKAEFHYQLANNAFYAKNPMEAISELYRAIDFDARHRNSLHLLGFIYFGREEFTEAERYFRAALEVDPGFYEARANLGALYLAGSRWQEAIDVLMPLVEDKLYPTPHLVQNNIGYAYQHLGKFEQAEKHYKIAVFLKPEMCLAHNNIGQLYAETGRIDLAVRAFDRAISRCPNYVDPYFHLGVIYNNSGQLDVARQSFQKCYELGPETPLGQKCSELGGISP